MYVNTNEYALPAVDIQFCDLPVAILLFCYFSIFYIIVCIVSHSSIHHLSNSDDCFIMLIVYDLGGVIGQFRFFSDPICTSRIMI